MHVVQRRTGRQGHGDDVVSALGGKHALLALQCKGGDVRLGGQLTGEIKLPVIQGVGVSRAAVIQEAQIPLGGVAALIGGHGVLRRGVGVGKVALAVIRVVQQGRQGALGTVGHAGIGVAVHAHGGHGAHDLRRALGGVNAAPLHAVGVFINVFAAEAVQHDLKALVQLGPDPFAIDRIIHVRADGLHQHGDHVKAEAVRQVFVVQDRLQQLVPRPERVRRNGVVAHVQGNQGEDGAVDGPAAPVVIEHLSQVVHLVALGVNIRLAVVVL